MTADRYVKAVLTVIAVALVAIAVNLWQSHLRPGPAMAQTLTPKYDVTIPKAWGKYLAYSNNNLLLEGSDGMWRVVDIEGKEPEYPKIKALIKWK